MNQQLLFFFSALGAFNGLLVGAYFLFFSRPKHFSNYLLGGLFLALSVRVGKSVFFYFYDSIADIYIQFGLFACWLIGPFLFFYVKSAIFPNRPMKKQALVALSAFALFGIAINLLFAWSAYPHLWRSFIKVIYAVWMVFVILTGGMLFSNRKLWLGDRANKPFKIWMASIYLGNLIICLAFNTGNYTSYIVGALSSSFVFYTLILLLLFYKRRDELIFMETKKYLTNKLGGNEAKEINYQLEKIMSEQELYLDPNLSLNKVSALLKIPTTKISQTLNEYSNANFNDFINSYRIAAAKEMIGIKKELTFEAIAMDCGFNSKSTFYAAFKKHTGMTPSQFRNQSAVVQ